MFNLVSFFVRARRFQETQRPSAGFDGPRQTSSIRGRGNVGPTRRRSRTVGAAGHVVVHWGPGGVERAARMFGQLGRRNATGANVGRVGKRWAVTVNLDLRHRRGLGRLEFLCGKRDLRFCKNPLAPTEFRNRLRPGFGPPSGAFTKLESTSTS
jgi:hypothetical protein